MTSNHAHNENNTWMLCAAANIRTENSTSVLCAAAHGQVYIGAIPVGKCFSADFSCLFAEPTQRRSVQGNGGCSEAPEQDGLSSLLQAACRQARKQGRPQPHPLNQVSLHCSSANLSEISACRLLSAGPLFALCNTAQMTAAAQQNKHCNFRLSLVG